MNITLLLICRLDTVCACALVRLLVISWSWCGTQSDRWSVSFTQMVFALILFIIRWTGVDFSESTHVAR